MDFVISEYVPEFLDVRKTVNLSLRERWIEPILHPFTIPFRPWVRYKTVVVKERTWYHMGSKIVCHPNNLKILESKGLINSGGGKQT